MTVLYFLATIVLLVVIHEWGHFATARFFGVGVRSFTVGFGKQVVSWVDPKTGTSWGIAPYPLGGYVGLLGEKEANELETTPTVTGNPFMAAPLHAKLAILFAGPLVNLVFAAMLYALLAYSAPPQPLPILATPPAGSAAAQAGLLSGDEVVAIDGQTMPNWRAVQTTLIQANAGQALKLTLASGQSKTLTMVQTPAKQTADEALGLRLLSLGLQVNRLIPQAPAEQAGMKIGDVLVAVNDALIDHPEVLLSALKAYKAGAEPLRIKVNRAGETAIANVRPALDAQGSYKMGVQFAGLPKLGTQTVGATEAVLDGVSTAYTASVLTVKAFGAFLLKPFTSDQLAGPITIAQSAKASADRGLIAALAFVAGLSISVGVLNLLPVPMLDGGQIVYHLFTAASRRVGITTQANTSGRLNQLWTTVGISFVLLLTVLAFYGDFKRLFGF